MHLTYDKPLSNLRHYDMVITHVRGEGLATDAELEALSLYMGHSVAGGGGLTLVPVLPFSAT